MRVREASVALKVVSMEELKLEVLFEPERSGESVAAVCRRRGISRASFYRYRQRYLAEGIDGLQAKPRQPLTSPARIDPRLEQAICALRKQHPRWGARRIRAELARAGVDAPAKSTIHRTLTRNHLVAPRPPRRRPAKKRFERPVANDLWQIDATQVKLASGGRVWVVDIVDDHARYLLAAHACEALSGEAVWACFVTASAAYGLPRQLLSDNGTYFTGRLHGVEVAFERRLADVGVELICAAPAHPETLGKLERFHRTLKEWLHDEGPASDIDELQTLLDRFRIHYNQERPHQGIGDLTPAERYLPTAPLGELTLAEPDQPVYPNHAVVRKVGPHGDVGYDGLIIGLGRRWAGAHVRIDHVDQLIHIYHGTDLVRSLLPDRSRIYQSRSLRPKRRP
jgi:transposase InsO family protein